MNTIEAYGLREGDVVVDLFDEENPRPADVGARTKSTVTLRWLDHEGMYTGETETMQVGALATPRFETLARFENAIAS